MVYFADGAALGMPAVNVEHQDVALSILANYLLKFKRRNVSYEVRVLDDPERIPDLSFWNIDIKYKCKRKNSDLMLTVEIVRTAQNESYSTKSIFDVFNRIPTLNESFMYNYKKDVWTRFSRKGGEVLVEEGKDYSRVLKCYMHTLLD